jgi:diaminohydroxyphosphoribosylaminopyrimidine deaminase / 5-amino-6-(5-phosphoribosylamino)uracil reductase
MTFAAAFETKSALIPLLAAPDDRSFVIGQLGQSLDGRIANSRGESLGINGPAALTHLHALRAHVDAVVVGAGTIAADNPRLTVRHIEGRHPARVVIDPKGRINDGHWLDDDGTPRLIITSSDHSIAGVQRIKLPAVDGMIDPHLICAALFERGYKKLLIEGGARTISHFLDHHCLTRLHILFAPLIIGNGIQGVTLSNQLPLNLAMRPKVTTYHLGDGDILFDCDLSHEVRHDQHK